MTNTNETKMVGELDKPEYKPFWNVFYDSLGSWNEDQDDLIDAVENSILKGLAALTRPPSLSADDLGKVREAMIGVWPQIDCDCPESPDDESIGWQGKEEIPVTFGQIRAFKAALEILNSKLGAKP